MQNKYSETPSRRVGETHAEVQSIEAQINSIDVGFTHSTLARLAVAQESGNLSKKGSCAMFWKKKAQSQISDRGAPDDMTQETSVADELVKRANDLTNALRDFEEAALAAEAKPEDAKLVDAQKKVAAAHEIVLDGRLGYALVSQLIDHNEHWPSWKDRDDFAHWVQFDADDIASEKKDISTHYKKMHEVRTDFSFHGKRYACVLRDQGYSSAPGDAIKFGESEFWDGAKLVLKVGLIDEISEFSRWRPFDVRAFKPGPWMQDLLSISAQIESRTNQDFNRHSDDDVREAARNIDL